MNFSGARFDFALLILRVSLALVFLYHGSGILFGAFGGPGPAGFAAHLHDPVVVGYLVGLAQFAGGLGILFGVLTRISVIAVMVVMLGAIFLIHLPHGFNVSSGGYEFALTVFLVAFALLLTGPGAFSLSSVLPTSLRQL